MHNIDIGMKQLVQFCDNVSRQPTIKVNDKNPALNVY